MYPFYQNPLQQLVTPQAAIATPAQTIQYVSGKESVDNYFLPPNSGVVLLDSAKKKMYINKTDATGAASIEVNDYHPAEEEKPVEYVTKAEFDKFKATMKGVKYEHNQPVNDTRKQ